MKTIREYIDLIESAQTPVTEGEISQQYTVAVDCGEDGTFTVKVHAGDKGEALRKAQKIVRNEYDTYPEGARIVGQGVAEGQATRTCPQCDGSGEDTLDPTKSCRRCGGKGHIPMSPREQGVAEALSKTDLLKQVSAKLNDPKFRKQPADPTKSFTKGDHWQGAKPGDYGYTGYQGHGMPTDRAERARIRADKKKDLPEDDATAQKYAVRMNAQQLGSTNRTKYTWTGTASSDDQAREMAIAYADRHGFKNIVVKEISKKEQAVDEQATPEAVAKINSLFSR